MNSYSQRRKQSGFTLIEAMVALVLGLIVVGAAGGIFLSNRKIYASTESVNRIQENQRAAFELISRDIREASGNPCMSFQNTTPITMATKSPDLGNYLADGIRGTNNDVNGSDTITLYSANGGNYAVTSHDNPSAVVDVATNAGLADGETVLICSPARAYVFTITGAPSDNKVQHNAGSTGGNCEKVFGACAGGSAQMGYCFAPAEGASLNPNCDPESKDTSPAVIVKTSMARWTVEPNKRNGNSLFRELNGTKQEIAEGVNSMQIKYKIGNAPGFVDVVPADQWRRVTAVNVELDIQATTGVLLDHDVKGTDGAALHRKASNVVTVRNHVEVL